MKTVGILLLGLLVMAGLALILAAVVLTKVGAITFLVVAGLFCVYMVGLSTAHFLGF